MGINHNTDPSESATSKGCVADRLNSFAEQFDERFTAMLSADGAPAELIEAMRYTAMAPGKRIRPFLVVRCCELVGGDREQAWAPAAAVECVHAFSLIHDDLPAMDDDDLRRGQPANHKRFGEGMAILAGDALVVLAFELLASRVCDSGLASRMVLALARGVGWTGMIGGQTVDILGQEKDPTLELAEYIHARKTASLFDAACRLGAMAGGGSDQQIDSLGGFGLDLGRAFQTADDLLDVTATPDALGKQVGKDSSANKQTMPRCVGVEESRRRALASVDEAIARIDAFGSAGNDLRELARYVVTRNY